MSQPVQKGRGRVRPGRPSRTKRSRWFSAAARDADQDVARADRRVRDVLVPELLEPAVLLERERLQAAPSPAFGAFTSTAMLP